MLGNPRKVMDWLYGFEKALTEREVTGSDLKARSFKICIGPGPPGKHRHDETPASVGGDYKQLEALLKNGVQRRPRDSRWCKKLEDPKLSDKEAPDESTREGVVLSARLAVSKVVDV